MTTQRTQISVAGIVLAILLVGGALYVAFDVQPGEVATEIGESAKDAADKVKPAITVKMKVLRWLGLM